MTFRLPLLLCLWTALLPAAAKPDAWIQVRSPHFTVVSNATEKQARHVAYQMERMRLVFQQMFPGLQVDPPMPIDVLAVKDQQDFQALEPPDYLGKGKLELSGYFLALPEKNYILMRLDVDDDEHPYATVCHEYTHVLTSRAQLPVWLNEGLAEFYENTDIQAKAAVTGQADAGTVQLLRSAPLLPLPQLLGIDRTSPYYHDQDKGSVFYAEAWALTHYLIFQDRQAGTHHLSDYVGLIAGHMDPVAAGTQAFGDLDTLQLRLDQYIQRQSFSALLLDAATPVDENSFAAEAIPAPQADALRADFMAYSGRAADARALLAQVLAADPGNVSARETLGYLERRAGNLAAAQKWYAEAVGLDSQSFQANFYFAQMNMDTALAAGHDAVTAKAEASLRAAIRINPGFAPAYNDLARLLMVRGGDLDGAHLLLLQAVQLDPSQLAYRENAASVLLRLRRPQDALAVMNGVFALAETPEQKAHALDEIVQIREMLEAQAPAPAPPPPAAPVAPPSRPGPAGGPPPVVVANIPGTGPDSGPPVLRHPPVLTDRPQPQTLAAPAGPTGAADGLIASARCALPASTLDITLQNGARTVQLHADNYFVIRFTAVNFKPAGVLQPCRDLQGLRAHVVYALGADKAPGGIIAMELRK